MTGGLENGSEHTASCPEYQYSPEYTHSVLEYNEQPAAPFSVSVPKKSRILRIYAYITGSLTFLVLGNSLAGAESRTRMAEPLFPADAPETYIAVLVEPSDTAWTAIYTSSDGASDTVKGLSYNAETNTLILRNADVERIETNMMGNGFTIELIGNSKAGTLSVWGWGYGGSLTITGTGSLLLNSNSDYGYGLIMYAECSESRLFIDKNVTLEARGSVAAVYINETVYSGNRPLIELNESVLCTGGNASEFDTDDGVIGHYMADIEGMPVSSNKYSASRDASFVTAEAPSKYIKIQPA